MRRKEIERAVRMEERAGCRRKNVGSYFQNTFGNVRGWFQELVSQYKQCGDFPILAMSLLPSYYEKSEDKEIAVFAALLCNDAGGKVLEDVSSLRAMLGEHPFAWFCERDFVSLSLGDNQNKSTGGVMNWRLAKLFDRLWQECYILHYEIPSEKTVETVVRPIGVQVELTAESQHCSFFDALVSLVDDCGVGDYSYRLRLLFLISATSDGFGLGLWDVDPQELLCPLTHDLRIFLQTWFPNYRSYGSVDDAIGLFGFERASDFFYAYLGYKELQKSFPAACRRFSSRYFRCYDDDTRLKPYEWKSLLPPVSF